jgi:predicted phage-related endonuclease
MSAQSIQQGSPEWFAARCGKATASRFSDVLAKLKSGGESASRKNYRARLVVERLTGKPLETFSNAAMQQGIEREPLARLAYEAETGNVVTEVGFFDHPALMAGASPDGLIGAEGLLEIKCPQLATHLEYLALDAEPAEYTAQIQGQMWILGMQWCDFVSFNPDFPDHLQLIVRRISRDDAFIAKLASEVAQFLEEVDTETKHWRIAA